MIPFTCPCCEVDRPPHRDGCTLHSDCPSEAETFDEVSSMRAEIARLRDERRWIPVGERLPEISEQDSVSRVLAAVEGGRVFELEFGMNVYAKTEKNRAPRWKWNGLICRWRVTHWQPLPAPPGVEVEGSS